jgi:hypothetical protein
MGKNNSEQLEVFIKFICTGKTTSNQKIVSNFWGLKITKLNGKRTIVEDGILKRSLSNTGSMNKKVLLLFGRHLYLRYFFFIL